MIDLDQFLDADAMAKVMGISKPSLLAHSTGSKPKVPVIRFNERLFKYHPRTVFAALARDAGVSLEVIRASLNLDEK